ncbi:MAG: hypothetical protein KUG81_11080 [Gammaproteobacteria bacterium]|nr:hypothetical protein [Gammaproteobacteria bacterium]
MNNKTQLETLEQTIKNAQETLEKAQQEVEQLKQKKKQSITSFGFTPEPQSSEIYYDLTHESILSKGQFKADSANANYSGDNYNYKLQWETEQEAQDFADALNVFMELRAQPGVVSFVNGDSQYCINIDGGIIGIATYYYISTLSPCFETEVLAKAAILNLGKDRIKKAFEVLCGIKQQ